MDSNSCKNPSVVFFPASFHFTAITLLQINYLLLFEKSKKSPN